VKAYVQTKDNLAYNLDGQCAIDGFESLNYEIKQADIYQLLSGAYDFVYNKYPFVGSIDFMTALFKRYGKMPRPIDFPKEIIDAGLIDREIKHMTLGEVDSSWRLNHDLPVFVKPVETKLFDGALLSNESDIKCFSKIPLDTLVWVSYKLNIKSEYRIYVHKGKMVYSANYYEDFTLSPDYAYVRKLIDTYKDSPVSYTIDVAILDDNSTTVIEFNDFWAIGSYGIHPTEYAIMAEERYFEIIKN